MFSPVRAADRSPFTPERTLPITVKPDGRIGLFLSPGKVGPYVYVIKRVDPAGQSERYIGASESLNRRAGAHLTEANRYLRAIRCAQEPEPGAIAQLFNRLVIEPLQRLAGIRTDKEIVDSLERMNRLYAQMAAYPNEFSFGWRQVDPAIPLGQAERIQLNYFKERKIPVFNLRPAGGGLKRPGDENAPPNKRRDIEEA
jgi:hypothetical protein